MITQKCACQKSSTSIIITSITWAGHRSVQEAATFLGPQNRTQGRCGFQPGEGPSRGLLRDCENTGPRSRHRDPR